MVALPQAVDVEKQAYQGGGGSPLIQNGQYQVVVVDSEKKDTKNGWAVVFKIVITHGECEGEEFNEYANLGNTNEKAVKAGYGLIANIGKAVNIAKIDDSSELHNKPFMIEVKAEKQDDWTNKDGDKVEGKMASKIKKYLPLPTTGVPQATAQVAGTVEQPEAAAEEAAPAANPFAAA